jgi:putative FmdB family regulatory protein
MPLFEYRCLGCQSEFELLVRGSTMPACPSCGATTLERLLSLFGVSSEGTQQRSRETLGAQQRVTRERARQEQTHYRHDHHDD